VQIVLKETSKVFISVNQKASRYSKQQASWVKLMLARDINYEALTPLELVDSKTLCADTMTVEAQL